MITLKETMQIQDALFNYFLIGSVFILWVLKSFRVISRWLFFEGRYRGENSELYKYTLRHILYKSYPGHNRYQKAQRRKAFNTWKQAKAAGEYEYRPLSAIHINDEVVEEYEEEY